MFNVGQTQINEHQILLNQARLLESRNQITQALEIYAALYEKYPTDENIVESLLRVSFATSDFKNARHYLDMSKGKLSPYFLVKQETLLLLKQNKIKEAERLAFDWLDKNRGMMHHFGEFARLFESVNLFDIAIEIYMKNRSHSNDSNIYAYELSNAYYLTKNVDRCFEESLKYLRLNPGFLYLYKNRINELVSAHKNNINRLSKLIGEKEPDQLYELLAFAHVEVKDYSRATEIYDKLPIDKLIRFADDLKSDSQLDYALSTYQRALYKTDIPIVRADLRIKIAHIHYEKYRIDDCIETLQLIIEDDEIQKPNIRNRTKANVEARMLMALISIQRNDSISTTKDWFESAIAFSINMMDKAEMLFQLARYLYLKEDYNSANIIIEQAINRQDINSSIYKSSYFYRYEVALFQNSDIRDSLLTECIIHFSQDPRITDMLFYETFLNNISDFSLKSAFLQALKYKGLYQDEQAISIILEIAEISKLDELYMLAYEWGMSSAHYHLVEKIESYSFNNPVFNDFIFLQSIRKNDNNDIRKRMISEFLNNNPQNIFSPQLRSILFNIRS